MGDFRSRLRKGYKLVNDMTILGEHYDERYGFDCDNYDPYDPFENDDIITYCDVNYCNECPRMGDDCDRKENNMKTEWIDTRTSKPTADGEYMVQKASGYVESMFYTVKGGWNTSYIDGVLRDEHRIEDISVARWLSVPTPPEVPQAWRDEWLNS